MGFNPLQQYNNLLSFYPTLVIEIIVYLVKIVSKNKYLPINKPEDILKSIK